ncbi:5-hydroxytryptamine receptor 2C [Sminthopsis crassicaudata]|uniref:5-hydroxytryptamine receptor 2C n=1 Tax=Sminthopsis crassicaudata TaxID=9301 RepID=UPI003D68B5E1
MSLLIPRLRALSSVLHSSFLALQLSRNMTDDGLDEYMNGTENATTPAPTSAPRPIHKNWAALLILIVIIITVAGNILVILAVTMEKKLQNATNFFLMSLAVADMLVGLLVMPVSVVTILYEYTWPLPKQLCPMWISLDVLFSTASIMHLCAISLDRYIAIRNPIEHSRFNSRTKAILKIAIVWTISMAVSLPIPIIGLRDESKVFVNGSCTLNEPNFVLIGSFVAFFIPLFIMVITYCLTIQVLQGQSNVFAPERRRKRSKFGCLRRERSAHNISMIHNPNTGGPVRLLSPGHREGYRKGTMQAIANERRASKVLGIVFFLFLLMWCPFFVTNIMAVMCTQSCRKSTLDELLSVFVWVGYVCSGINPLVYTLFNKTYRRAFLKYLSFGWLGTTKSPPRQLPVSAANLYPREYTGRQYTGRDFTPRAYVPREYSPSHHEDDVPQIVPIEDRPMPEVVEVVIEMEPCSPQPVEAAGEDTCTVVNEKVTSV